MFERTEDMATREFFMELMETSGLSDYIMQKGMQQGRLEGMQQGRLEGAQEVIDLLEKGYSLSDAKEMLQLTEIPRHI
jgi:flagellar biosynthesis/type III secretory pathway protein FliH